MAADGEEAGEDFTDGGEPQPGAVPAERLGYRCDDTEFAAAVAVTEAVCHFAGIARRERVDRPVAGNPSDDFRGGHDVGGPPPVGIPDVHVFNEPHDVPVVAGECGEFFDVAVVDPPSDDGIELYREESSRSGGVNSGEDVVEGNVGVGEAGE